MSDPTKQTKIGEQEEDNIARVTKLILDLVNAPAYALFMVYKDFIRDIGSITVQPPTTKAYRTLQCSITILKRVLALKGVDADSETL